MRRLLVAAFALIPFLASGSEYPYTYERVKVAEGIYAFMEPFGRSVVSSNIVAIVGEEGVAIVDSGQHPRLTRAIAAEIKTLTPKPVLYVVNTHWHNDHVVGNAQLVEAFPQAKVIAHAFTSSILENDVRPFIGPNCASLLKVQSKTLRDMLASNTGSDGTPLTEVRRKRVEGFVRDADAAIEDCAEIRFRGTDITFEDKLTLRLGKREVHLLHLGRANTAGDIVAWVPDAKVLAAGDLIVHPFPFATQSYITEWAAVLRKLDAMPFEILVPGHGPLMRDRRYLREITDLMESIMSRSRAAYRPGMTSEELRKAVDLKDFRQRIAGDDPFLRANFDYMAGNLAVTRAWEELRGKMEPEGIKPPT